MALTFWKHIYDTTDIFTLCCGTDIFIIIFKATDILIIIFKATDIFTIIFKATDILTQRKKRLTFWQNVKKI